MPYVCQTCIEKVPIMNVICGADITTYTFLSQQKEFKNVTQKFATTNFCPWLYQFPIIKKNQSDNPGSCPENAVFPYLLGCDVKPHPTATILISVCAMWNCQSPINNTLGENYILLPCCKTRPFVKKQLRWQVSSEGVIKITDSTLRPTICYCSAR
jgi:hypothetical protein